MRHASSRPLWLALAAAASLLSLTIVGFSLQPTVTAPSSSGADDRFYDPVILTTVDLPAYEGLPNWLTPFKYVNGNWLPVAFQIDQRTNDVTGTFTYDDGDGFHFDANDEIVIWGGDWGDQAPATLWHADPSTFAYGRYELEFSDPLNPGPSGWLYIFVGDNLPPYNIQHVVWQQAEQTATSFRYAASFGGAAATPFVGLSDLLVAGNSADILDRQRTTACITEIGGACIVSVNEETILGAIGASGIITPLIGPVRVIGGNELFSAKLYPHRLDLAVTVDLSDQPVNPAWVETGFDLTSPVSSGVDRYYDSNTLAGVVIDGSPDAVADTPLAAWHQVSGPGGGMAVIRSDSSPGTINLYRDDLNAGSTGDGASYGEAGVFNDNLNGLFTLEIIAYILPTNTLNLVGPTYYANAITPYSVTANFSAPPGQLFMPAVLAP